MGFLLAHAFRNLRRNRLRSTVTLLGVACLLFLVSFLASIVGGLRGSSERDTGALRLVTRHEISLTFNLPESYGERILRIPGVTNVSPSNWFGGRWVDDNRQFARFFVDPALFEPFMAGIEIPRDQFEAWRADRRGCIIPKDVADRWDVRLGDVMTLEGDIYPLNPELVVLGIYEGEEQSLYFHRALVEEGLGRAPGVGTYWTLVDAPERLGAVAKAVDAAFENSDAPTKTETEQAFRAGFVSMLGNVEGFLGQLSLVLAVTILLTAGNTMAMGVRERRTEIAVLRALGFLPGRVVALIVAESSLLGLLAGLVGIGGFAAGAWILFDVMGARVPNVWFDLTLTARATFLLILGATALGAASGLVPALVAARGSVVAGLRRL